MIDSHQWDLMILKGVIGRLVVILNVPGIKKTYTEKQWTNETCSLWGQMPQKMTEWAKHTSFYSDILTHKWLSIYTFSNFVNFESFSTDSDELHKFLKGWIASAVISLKLHCHVSAQYSFLQHRGGNCSNSWFAANGIPSKSIRRQKCPSLHVSHSQFFHD